MTFRKINSGSLYTNKYKVNPDQPDLTGTAYLDASMLQEMVNTTEPGEPIKVAISGWTNTLPSGDSVINVIIKKPWVKKEEARQEIRQQVPEIKDEDVPF